MKTNHWIYAFLFLAFLVPKREASAYYGSASCESVFRGAAGTITHGDQLAYNGGRSPDAYVQQFDDWMMGKWNCSSAVINMVWRDFNMDLSWKGFGYEAACDTRQPMARMFDAAYLLYFMGDRARKSSCWDCAGSLLDTAYNFVKITSGFPWNRVTKAGCTNRANAVASAKAITYYAPFHYQLTLTPRAGVILHENRHIFGNMPHGPDNSCRNGGSCDPSWEYNGANTWQATWLWWVYARGYLGGMPAVEIEGAGYEAQSILDIRFAKTPGFRILR